MPHALVSRWLPAHRQEEARAIGRRTHQTLLFAAATGVVVGLVVLAIERITVEGLLDTLAEQPLWMQALAPMVGLLGRRGLPALGGGAASPSTSDEYVAAFHDQGDEPVPLRPVFGRIVASIATIGYGGALGLEGPSIYAGSVIGSTAQRRFARFFSREDAKLLLVAGAAAGVAAIFKAPATGALFAIEVPYRADVARRNILPAMVAAASSYVAFAAVDGTTPILPVDGHGSFGWAEIGGALVVGLLCGVGARLFSAAIRFLRGRSVTATATRDPRGHGRRHAGGAGVALRRRGRRAAVARPRLRRDPVGHRPGERLLAGRVPAPRAGGGGARHVRAAAAPGGCSSPSSCSAPCPGASSATCST